MCEKCQKEVDPNAQSKLKGYYVTINHIEQIQKILENKILRTNTRFFDETSFKSNVGTFDDFSSSRVYRERMKNGDISLSIFVDGVNAFESASCSF